MTNNDMTAAYMGVSAVTKICLGEDVVWPVIDYSQIPLTFEIISGGTIIWSTPTTSMRKTIQYKKNGGEMVSITSNTGTSAPSIPVEVGDVLEFYGNNTTYAYYSYGNYINQFSNSTALFKVYGNIMSLLYGTNFIGQDLLPVTNSAATFMSLFKNCTSIISAKNLIFPAQNINDVAKGYYMMFKNCTNLEKGPTIMASALTSVGVCGEMFFGCEKLSYLKCLSLTVNKNATGTWVNDVAPTGTFVKHPNMTSWPKGTSGIPAGWTVEDAVI